MLDQADQDLCIKICYFFHKRRPIAEIFNISLPSLSSLGRSGIFLIFEKRAPFFHSASLHIIVSTSHSISIFPLINFHRCMVIFPKTVQILNCELNICLSLKRQTYVHNMWTYKCTYPQRVQSRTLI